MSANSLNRLLTALDTRNVPIKGRVKAIADKTGYSSGMVSKVLSGKVDSIDRFVKVVCSEFGICKEWVEEGKEPTLELKSDGTDAFVNEILNDLASLTLPQKWIAVGKFKEIVAGLRMNEKLEED